ncbi:MAG TPA: AI-2E family transporter [Phototrophicaceae bacterium]|nr:AI-2E family transporter [Phototrophicaceae bacterium]
MTSQQVFRNTVIILVTAALAYVLLLSIRIWVVLLVAILIASALRPVVVRLTGWRMPQGLAILLVYILVGVLIASLLIGVLPPILNQIGNYIENDWQLANRIIVARDWGAQFLNQNIGQDVELPETEEIRSTISTIVGQIRRAIPTLLGEFSGVAGEAVLAFVIGVYWLTSRDSAVNFVLQLFPITNREEVKETIDTIETSLGNYVRGVILVASFVGIANFAILTMLRVPNAATLGFIIGVTTMLPVIGGFLGGGLAALLALLTNPLHAVITLATFVGVQQIETHILTPRVMSRSVGIDPILVIVTVFIGFTLGGVMGAIIAVPIVGMIYIILRRHVIEPRKASVSPYIIKDGLIVLNAQEEEAEAEKSL